MSATEATESPLLWMVVGMAISNPEFRDKAKNLKADWLVEPNHPWAQTTHHPTFFLNAIAKQNREHLDRLLQSLGLPSGTSPITDRILAWAQSHLANENNKFLADKIKTMARLLPPEQWAQEAMELLAKKGKS